MANQNPFRPLVHWFINPPHGVRFVSQFNGSIDIEFEPGREDEVADYMHQWLDAHRDRSHSMASVQAPALPVAAEQEAQPSPQCDACAWAKEHPTTQCSIHGKKPQQPPQQPVAKVIPIPPPPIPAPPPVPQATDAVQSSSQDSTKTDL